MKQFIVVFVVGIIFASCTGKSGEKVEPLDSEVILHKSESFEGQSNVPHPGESVYRKYCLQCHQADGSGIPGMHPPLSPNNWISGEKEKLIEISLKGLYGEIEVDGEIYNNLMPPHDHLTDLELSKVLSYVRSSFGNKFEAVSQKEVAAVRQKLKL